MLRVLVAFLIAALLTFSAFGAEHDGEFRGRPEAEPAEKTCGEKIGEVTFRHKGKGLFFASDYSVTATFTDEGGLRVRANHGANLDIEIIRDPLSVRWGGQTFDCKDKSNGALTCLSLIKKAQRKIDLAQERRPPVSSEEGDAYWCVLNKLVNMESECVYYTPRRFPDPDDSPPARQSDSGGIGFTYDGKVGTKLGGGLVLPFDGSGIQLGY